MAAHRHYTLALMALAVLQLVSSFTVPYHPRLSRSVSLQRAKFDGQFDDMDMDNDEFLASMDAQWGITEVEDLQLPPKVPVSEKKAKAKKATRAPVATAAKPATAVDDTSVEGKIAGIIADLPVLGEQGKFHKAVRKYKSLRKLGGFANGPAYTGILKACAAGKIPQLAEKVVQDMVERPPEGGLQMMDLHLALTACVGGARPDEALRILVAMAQGGLAPDLKCFELGLLSCTKGRSIVTNEACAREMMLQMRTAGLEFQYSTYSILLSVFVRARRNTEALDAFELMCKRGPATKDHYRLAMTAASREQDTTTIKALMGTAMAEPSLTDEVDNMIALAVKSVADAGDWELACKLLQRLPLPRARHLYHAAIASCCRAKQLQVALALFDRMSEDGHSATRATFNAILHCAQSMGDSVTAKRVLAMMNESGMRLNVVTYNIALNARAKVGDVYGSIKLLEQMQEEGVSPSVVSYATAVNAAARANNSALAVALLDAMNSAGVKPNEYVFTAAIASCENDEDNHTAAESAQRILDVMASVGLDKELDEIKQRVVKQITRQLQRDPSVMDNKKLKEDEEKLGMRLYGRQTAI